MKRANAFTIYTILSASSTSRAIIANPCCREKPAVSSSAQRLFLPGDIAHTMKEQTDCQKHTHSNRTACERYARYTAIRWQRAPEQPSTGRTASADQQDTANSAPAAYSLAVSSHALSFQRE